MYRKNIIQATSIEENDSLEGETIEQKIERVVNNKEPITDGAPMIYTERKEGVLAGYNVRTDRFEVAIDAMDKVSKTHAAKRADRMAEKEAKIVNINKDKNGGAESTQGTEN